MMDRLVEEFIELGFPERVARVYVELVKRGTVSIPRLAVFLKLPRSVIHDVSLILINHGFVTKNVINGVVVLTPAPPLVIRKTLEDKLRESEAKIDRFDALLPNLKALSTLTGDRQPAIRLIEGIEGLKMFQQEFAALPGDILQLFDYDTFQTLGLGRLTDDHRSQLVKLKKRVRSMVLTSGPVFDREIDGYEIKVISKDCVSALGEMSVCDDRVLLLSYVDGLTAIEIRSLVIADLCRAALELAWSTAVRIDQNHKNG